MRIQFNRRKYQELVYPPARWINSLEIIWTIPLLTVGILGLLDSLVIGIAITVALLPWMARWLWIGRPTCRAFLSGPMLLFVISGFLSMGVTYDPTLSWPMLLTLLGCISLFFAIVNASVGSESVAKGVIVIASMVALYFAGQYTHFHYPLETGRLAGLGRVTGGLLPNFVFVTPHPNTVARVFGRWFPVEPGDNLAILES